MEKLQAALARAREKRETDGGTPRGPAHQGRTTRDQARKKVADEGIAAAWASLANADPDSRRLNQSRIFAGTAVSEAQAFDILRAKLLLEMRQQGWTRIAITSATPGCGKTTVACNLIAGMSRQPDVRGILFDFDLRRPSVGRFFGVTPPESIASVLDGSVDFARQAMQIADNAALSVATGPVSDPARLMTRNSVTETLDEIQSRFRPDIMIFDTPPVLVSDEARALLKLVDATLIIAQAEQSTVAQIDEAEREVAQYSSVAGVVLNKLVHTSGDSGYDY